MAWVGEVGLQPSGCIGHGGYACQQLLLHIQEQLFVTFGCRSSGLAIRERSSCHKSKGEPHVGGWAGGEAADSCEQLVW
jgi:hypothetical protein